MFTKLDKLLDNVIGTVAVTLLLALLSAPLIFICILFNS